MSLFQKILELQREVVKVPKDGTNTHFRYKYVSESALIEKCMEAFSAKGLVVLPNLLEMRTFEMLGKATTEVMYEYTVVDVESGESHKMRAGGMEQGDKCAFKAMTGANKYFWLRFLQVATGDDPERDEQPQKPQPARNNTKPMPARDFVKPDPRAQCKESYGGICQIAQFNQWDRVKVQAITGLSGEDIAELVSVGNESAALELGNAFLQMKTAEQKAQNARKQA